MEFCLLLLTLVLSAYAENPWITRSGSDHQYQFHNDETSWIFAREKCLAQNSDFITINDKEELDWLSSFYPVKQQHLRDRYVLLGLSREKFAANWEWVDGSAFNESVIDFGEFADENCAFLEVGTQQLNHINCDVRVLAALFTRYVCERTPAQAAHVVGLMPVKIQPVRGTKKENNNSGGLLKNVIGIGIDQEGKVKVEGENTGANIGLEGPGATVDIVDKVQ